MTEPNHFTWVEVINYRSLSFKPPFRLYCAVSDCVILITQSRLHLTQINLPPNWPLHFLGNEPAAVTQHDGKMSWVACSLRSLITCTRNILEYNSIKTMWGGSGDVCHCFDSKENSVCRFKLQTFLDKGTGKMLLRVPLWSSTHKAKTMVVFRTIFSKSTLNDRH